MHYNLLVAETEKVHDKTLTDVATSVAVVLKRNKKPSNTDNRSDGSIYELQPRAGGL